MHIVKFFLLLLLWYDVHILCSRSKWRFKKEGTKKATARLSRANFERNEHDEESDS